MASLPSSSRKSRVALPFSPMEACSHSRFITAVILLCAVALQHVSGHGDEDCDMLPGEKTVHVPFVPGTVTVDGNHTDWSTVTGMEFMLQHAVSDTTYSQGLLTLKAAHDGINIYFLLLLPGLFTYNASDPYLCPAAAMMFRVGDKAEYHEMGNCPNIRGVCGPDTCKGYEVDIVQFKVSTAIPGRLYGGNILDNSEFSGADRFGKLQDEYAWNAHCRNVDGPIATEDFNSSSPRWGAGGSQNDWRGAWGHSSIHQSAQLASDSPYGVAGAGGSYAFEFSRPLRTTDRLQQDLQLTFGVKHLFGIAVWYPENESTPWRGIQHFIATCNWLGLELMPASVPSHGWLNLGKEEGLSNSAAAAVSLLALLIALSAIFVSIVVGWWVRNNTQHQFARVEQTI